MWVIEGQGKQEILRKPAEQRHHPARFPRLWIVLCALANIFSAVEAIEHLVDLDKLQASPETLKIGRIGYGNGIEITVTKHKAKFHKTCSIKYNNKFLLSAQKRSMSDNGEGTTECPKRKLTRVFTEKVNSDHAACFFCSILVLLRTISFIDVVTPVFRLRTLTKMFQDRVTELGGYASTVHSTLLKDKILNYMPELRPYAEGRDLYLDSPDDVGQSLLHSSEYDAETKAVIVSRAAKIIRKDALKNNCQPFNGTFSTNCQQNSVPDSLLCFMSLIMNDTCIDESEPCTQPILSLSQLLAFNDRSSRASLSGNQQHYMHQETPLPLFFGAYIHSRTRSKEMIETFYSLGLSVSYVQVLTMSADLGNTTDTFYEDIGMVSPQSFQKCFFATAAVDNLDHNPFSMSAKS
ncbi:hypothetical protein PR048_026155 [Dryococelus australis]|uniref:Uncharacterized protein n=1 Tax=Dryococelus australis TaxID=614101 RepID=A0ABQ9GKL5_9NEOP|nr:hypothetical protein PR048_026155 [Dryococelus australis]